MLEIRLLGALAVAVDGRAVTLRPGRARAVLARLALDEGRSVARDELVRALWEDDPPASAVNVIQVAVSFLRRELGAASIRTGAAGYSLGPASVDVTAFLRDVRSGRRAAEAGEDEVVCATLAHVLERFEPPLDDFGGEPFVGEARRALTEQYVAAVEAYAPAAIRIGRAETVLPMLTDLVRTHPLREGLLEQLVLGLGALGRETEALAAYDAGRRRIADELGVDPGTRLRSAYERVLRHDPLLRGGGGEHPIGDYTEGAGAAALPIPPAARGNLPRPASSFIGREQEIADLVEALRTARLATITGFGGMGKTRLAVQVATVVSERGRIDAWFVDLSTVDRVTSIGPAIADAMGVDVGLEDALGPVLRWLRGRRLLLVLDNLEQLLPAVGDVVVRLLAAAPGLQVLATSREPLRLLGEEVFALPPFATPPRTAVERRIWTAGDIEALLELPSVRLFAERATAARHGFAVTPGTAQAVAAICARLEGSPLALELVAVRLRAQSPQALRPRLDRALDVAAGGIRDLPARQQTLRATIEWSVRALGPGEQQLLWRLSVFPGSFTAEAAALICAPRPGADLLTDLLALVDRSLVQVSAADEVDGTDRFNLLVPVREFAAERLSETEPDGTTMDRHADHFARAARLDPDGTPDDRSALATLIEEDWHNVRAALDRLHERRRFSDEVALSPALGRCLQYLGREGAAISLLRHAVDHLDPEDGSDGALSALMHLAAVEYESDGPGAVEPLLRADRLLDRAQSPALTVFLAAYNTIMQDPCRAGPELFDTAYALLGALSDRGNALPRWYVATTWIFAAICVGDRRADGLQADLQADRFGVFRGRERLALQCGLGVNLCLTDRFTEAEELLAAFADDAVRSTAYPSGRVLPLMVLADIRMATGRAAEAAQVLDAAQADLAVFDQPWEHGAVQVQRAAIDRSTGRPDAAAARLDRFLGSRDAEGLDTTTGFARWMLAVIERERGRPAAARAQLRSAWTVANGSPEEHLTITCLLERCVQRQDEPVEALPDFAMAATHPARAWLHLGVTYDTAALRRSFERRLGRARIDAAFAAAAGRDLALPDWDRAA